jgi:hypothetical protein
LSPKNTCEAACAVILQFPPRRTGCAGSTKGKVGQTRDFVKPVSGSAKSQARLIAIEATATSTPKPLSRAQSMITRG